MTRPIILVVDDDYAARSITKAKLGIFAEADVAVDGLDAVERVSARKYDAVIVDLGMPMIDGVDLVRILRSRASTKSIPIVVVSASEDPALRKRALANGATCAFAKPLNWLEFIRHLRHLLVRIDAPDVEPPTSVLPSFRPLAQPAKVIRSLVEAPSTQPEPVIETRNPAKGIQFRKRLRISSFFARSSSAAC